MNSSNLIISIISLAMMVAINRACNINTDPCGSNQCCQLVFNLRVLSYSYCRNRNRDTDRCAQNNYCLTNEECASNVCEGARTFKWGRCTSPPNPCLKKIFKLNPES